MSMKIAEQPSRETGDSMIPNKGRVFDVIVRNKSFDNLRPCREHFQNATLRRDQWEKLDDNLMEAARQNLVGVQDLRDMDMVNDDYEVFHTLSTIERADQGLEAERSMSGRAPAPQHNIEIDELSFAIPFYQVGFGFGARALGAARQTGQPLDMETAREGMDEVMDIMEGDLFNGASLSYRGGSIPGYTTESNRNTYTGSDWGTTTNVIPDVNSAEEQIGNAGYDNSPLGLYVANTQFYEMKSISSNLEMSPLDYIQQERDQIQFVKKSGKLSSGTAVLVALQTNVVDLIIAEDLNNVEWEDPSGTFTNFKSMFVGVPRVKSDKEGNSGIVEITGI